MNARTRTRRRTALVALTAAALIGAVAAVALANVTIYRNDFSSRGEVREVKKSGGKQCKKRFAGKGRKRALKATVAKGPSHCKFRPPVTGDSAVSDHDLRVIGKIAKGGAKAVRKSSFFSVETREGGGTGYELRVTPKGKRFRLMRSPNGDGFPVSGKSSAINRATKPNRLRLVTFGARVRALVNGRLVAAVTDASPGQVSGTRLRFGVGHRRNTGKNLVARFTKVTVSVPNP